MSGVLRIVQWQIDEQSQAVTNFDVLFVHSFVADIIVGCQPSKATMS